MSAGHPYLMRAVDLTAGLGDAGALSWSRAWAPAYAITPAPVGGGPGRYMAATWRVGALVFARLVVDDQALRHDPRHARATGDHVTLQRLRRGRADGHADGRPVALEPGGPVLLLDHARPFALIYGPSVIESVFAPKTLVEAAFEAENPVLRFSAGDPAGAALNASLDAVFAALDGGDRPAVDDAVNHFSQALTAASAAAPAPSVEARRKASASAFIETRLPDAAFEIAEILDRFALSRATLYRMFEAEGGVRRYIQDRRLIRAALELVAAAARRGRVHMIASGWGFSSDSAFNRAVRKRFAVAPAALQPRSDLNNAVRHHS